MSEKFWVTTTSAKQLTEDVAVSKLVLSASDSWLEVKAGIKLKPATEELTLSMFRSCALAPQSL